jgi:hypothetical protein
VAISIEPLPEGSVCVWCWKEITADQPALELKKGAHAHLACDSRMLNFISGLEGYLDA